NSSPIAISPCRSQLMSPQSTTPLEDCPLDKSHKQKDFLSAKTVESNLNMPLDSSTNSDTDLTKECDGSSEAEETKKLIKKVSSRFSMFQKIKEIEENNTPKGVIEQKKPQTPFPRIIITSEDVADHHETNQSVQYKEIKCKV